MCGPLSLVEWWPVQTPEVLGEGLGWSPHSRSAWAAIAKLHAAPLLTRDWGSVPSLLPFWPGRRLATGCVLSRGQGFQCPAA